MRNRKSSVVSIAAVAMLLAACSSGSAAEGGDARLALLDSGNRTDFAWAEAWYDGFEAAKAELSDSVEMSYTDQLDGADGLERAAGAALSEGATAVIISTSEAPQALDRLGEQFPDAFLCGVEAPREEYRENVCTIDPRMEEGAFLAGVLAGKVTETGTVGVVGAFDSPTLTSQMEGFALGVKYADPDVTVHRAYTMSLSDAGAARAAAEAQYDAGADIIFGVVSEGRTGIFAAAEERGGLVIGANGEWYDEAPDLILSSVEYNYDLISSHMLKLAAGGELEARAYEFKLSDGPYGVLAEPEGIHVDTVTDEVWAEVMEVQKALEEGTLSTPNAHVIGIRDIADDFDLADLQTG